MKDACSVCKKPCQGDICGECRNEQRRAAWRDAKLRQRKRHKWETVGRFANPVPLPAILDPPCIACGRFTPRAKDGLCRSCRDYPKPARHNAGVILASREKVQIHAPFVADR